MGCKETRKRQQEYDLRLAEQKQFPTAEESRKLDDANVRLKDHIICHNSGYITPECGP